MKHYITLNDAAPAIEGLARGNTKIWYTKNNAFHLFMWRESADKFNKKTPDSTHTLLGSIKEDNLESIFTILQGEVWSPNGEARGLLESKGLGHTSMSIGDVVQVDEYFFIVSSIGFKKL